MGVWVWGDALRQAQGDLGIVRMIWGLGGRPHPNPPPEGEGIYCVGDYRFWDGVWIGGMSFD